MSIKERAGKVSARTRELQDKAREQYERVDVRADTILHHVADTFGKWTPLVLAAYTFLAGYIGFLIGRAFG